MRVLRIGLFFLGLFLAGALRVHESYGTEADTAGSFTALPSNRILELVASTNSIGSLAICEAEGNCQDGIKTYIYNGHKDPGNKVMNYGFCSDQGEGGGTVEGADIWCLENLKERIPYALYQFEALYLNTDKHWIGILNTLDLYNQASPRVSESFPTKYRNALSHQGEGWDAIVHARVEAFRTSDGILNAGNLKYGLFGICYREPFYRRRLYKLPLMREAWRYKCIELDQRRRVTAIKNTITRLNAPRTALKIVDDTNYLK